MLEYDLEALAENFQYDLFHNIKLFYRPLSEPLILDKSKTNRFHVHHRHRCHNFALPIQYALYLIQEFVRPRWPYDMRPSAVKYMCVIVIR